MKIERHLSRQITIQDEESTTQYKLSVVTLYRDSIGNIERLTIEPYTQESEGVEYHDTPLLFKKETSYWEMITE
jgi:hypothetical protein